MTRGLEFSTQPYDLPRAEVLKNGPLFDTPVFRILPAKSTVRASFLMFYAQVPAGFVKVDDVQLAGSKLVIEDRANKKTVKVETVTARLRELTGNGLVGKGAMELPCAVHLDEAATDSSGVDLDVRLTTDWAKDIGATLELHPSNRSLVVSNVVDTKEKFSFSAEYDREADGTHAKASVEFNRSAGFGGPSVSVLFDKGEGRSQEAYCTALVASE